MENLNAEEIIKAMECCTSGRPCRECAYKDKSTDTFGCRKKCLIDALALIKSQEQRIKELAEENERLHATRTELTRVQEENEAWQMQLISEEEKANKAYYELACEVEDLRAENERLTKNLETERGRRKMLLQSYQQLVDENLLLIQNKYGKESNPHFVKVGHKKYHEYRIRFETE